MASFAKKVLTVRKQCGLNQTQFAKALGVSQGTVSRWEAGKQDCNTDAAFRLSEFSEKPITYWLVGDNYHIKTSYAEIRYVLKAGVWVDYSLLSDIDHVMVDIPVIGADLSKELIGYYLDSENMNNVFKRGTIIFANSIDLNWTPVSGAYVVVQRRDINDLFELAVWELKLDHEGNIKLCPNSTDPFFQEPEDPLYNEHTSAFEIMGLVIGSFQMHA